MENQNLTAHILQSSEIGEWAKAMAEFHKELRPIQKDAIAKQNIKKKDGSYMEITRRYLSLDGILDYVRPLLSKNGLFVAQELTGDGLSTTIFHSSGQYRTSIFPMSTTWEGSPMTNSIQNAGGSFTYLKRYALSAALAISADEDTDGADHNPKQQQRQQPSQAKPQQKGPPPPAPQPQKQTVDQAKSLALAKMKEIIGQINPTPEVGAMIMQGIYGVANSKEVTTLKTAAIEQGNNWLIGFQHDYAEYQEYQQTNKEPESTEYVQGLIKKSTEIPF